MAATRRVALGIDLGVDFSALGQSFNKVGDKIEELGKKHSIKLGATVADVAGGKFDPEKLGAMVARVGTSLSSGMAAGVRASGSLMTGLGVHINATLNRLSGASITMFRRVDAAMKFPIFYASLKSTQMSLSNFTKVIGRGPLTTLDKAAGGAYGKLPQIAARVVRELIASLQRALFGALKSVGARIAGSIGTAIGAAAVRMEAAAAGINLSLATIVGSLDRVAAAVAKVVENIAGVQSGARAAVPILGEMAAAAGRAAAAPADLAGPVAPRRKVPGVGRYIKLGAGERADQLVKGPGPDPFADDAGRPKSVARLSPPPPPAPAPAPAPTPPTPRPQSWRADAGHQAPPAPAGAPAADRDRFVALGAAGAHAATLIRTGMADARVAVRAVRDSTLAFSRTFLQVGAALVSVPLRLGIGIFKVRNFLTSLGDVGKKSFHDLYESHGLFVSALLYGTRAVGGLASGLFRLATLRPFRKQEEEADGAGRSAGRFAGATGRAGTTLANLGATALSVGHQVLQAFELGFVIFKFVGWLRGGVKAARDLEATVARSKVTFGDSFGAVRQQADELSRKFGLVAADQLVMANEFGRLAQGAGMAEDASAGFANRMVRLAGDFSQSVGIPFQEAGEKLKKALTDGGDSLREFGVRLDEDTVRAAAGVGANDRLAASHHRLTRARATARVRTIGTVGVPRAGVTRERRVQHLAPHAGPRPRNQGADLDELTSVTTRARLATDGLSFAQGGLERSSRQASGAFLKAGGGLAEFGARLGTALLPATQAVVAGFNKLLGAVLDFADRNRAAIEGWSQWFGAQMRDVVLPAVDLIVMGFGKARDAVNDFVTRNSGLLTGWADWVRGMFTSVGSLVRNFGDNWRIAQLRVGEFVGNALAYLKTLGPNITIVAGFIRDNWRDILTDLANFTKNLFLNLGANAQKFGTAIWDAIQGRGFKMDWTRLDEGFQRKTKELPALVKPELISFQDEVDTILARIAEKEQARLRGLKLPPEPELPAKKTPGPVVEPMKVAEYRLAGAVEVGSKEAYSAVVKNQATGPKSTTGAVNDLHATARQHLAVAREQLAVVRVQNGPALAVK